jgi:hypothetical protein
MADKPNTKQFFYYGQLRNYIVQFMTIFSELTVMVGKTGDLESRLINVPVVYGSKDKVVASIKAEGTVNKPIRLPAISVELTGLDLAPENRKGVGNTRRTTYMPNGGVFPDDVRVIHQLMPIPYKITMELVIFASNTQQHHQILEQLLVLFDPILQIQTSDEVFDWTKITTVELKSVNMDENYPINGDRRIIQSTLNFEIPIQLSVPANIRADYVAKVSMRLGELSNPIGTIDINGDTLSISEDLDDQGIPYDILFNLNDITGIQ